MGVRRSRPERRSGLVGAIVDEQTVSGVIRNHDLASAVPAPPEPCLGEIARLAIDPVATTRFQRERACRTRRHRDQFENDEVDRRRRS